MSFSSSLAVSRNDVCDWASNHLHGAEAEDLFHPLVPAHNDSFQVFVYDTVVCGIDDGGKKSLRRRKTTKCLVLAEFGVKLPEWAWGRMCCHSPPSKSKVSAEPLPLAEGAILASLHRCWHSGFDAESHLSENAQTFVRRPPGRPSGDVCVGREIVERSWPLGDAASEWLRQDVCWLGYFLNCGGHRILQKNRASQHLQRKGHRIRPRTSAIQPIPQRPAASTVGSERCSRWLHLDGAHRSLTPAGGSWGAAWGPNSWRSAASTARQNFK